MSATPSTAHDNTAEPQDLERGVRIVNAAWTARQSLAEYRASQRPASPTEALERRCEALESTVAALWDLLWSAGIVDATGDQLHLGVNGKRMTDIVLTLETS